MNDNVNQRNPPLNANAYYGTDNVNNQQQNNMEQGVGYAYRQDNSPNYNNNNVHNYPQTGLEVADAENNNSRSEFILPESLKVGMIVCSIFCLLCFFIVLLTK